MHKEQLREQQCITLTLSVLCKGEQMNTYKLFWKLATALGEWGYVLPKRIGISYSKWLCSRLLHVYETGISSHDNRPLEMYMFTKPNPSYNSNRNHSCKKVQKKPLKLQMLIYSHHQGFSGVLFSSSSQLPKCPSCVSNQILS